MQEDDTGDVCVYGIVSAILYTVHPPATASVVKHAVAIDEFRLARRTTSAVQRCKRERNRVRMRKPLYSPARGERTKGRASWRLCVV
ncbi:hypothetical protein B0A50_04514 [Salinomyces thailandicus]|uniref:Uncharacterized protein n=1 Tax=Salinomyces thailandicus TaxID=706561 RepID=A0A4U0TXR0_9PEZI|nr:hypothetical protein B0A50_04514 [Salinomyces thailandica]